ncbi:MAG: hypothetical protein M3552_07015 [Planctomycetota bacterium]|nr:hypothetical protein [Planctomycetaceae bacterium]MDQ3330386.1 hypothetical protein [Planctomycetota bacterium]
MKTPTLKNPLLWLTVAAIIVFGVAGMNHLGTATSNSANVKDEVRTPALISGITCVTIASGLLVFGIISFRGPKNDAEQGGDGDADEAV